MKYKKDLISVIMPTYNRADMIEQRIKEFQAQTYENWELIIINDNSTDKTKWNVWKYLWNQDSKTGDERVHLINLDKNSGCVTIPRNIGISQCNGEFICHCDDDDFHAPYKLEKLHKMLVDHPNAILAYGDRAVLIDGKEEIARTPNWDPRVKHGVGNGQYLYRANVYEKIPLVFCKRACDWELAKHLVNHGSFVYTTDIMVKVLWHGGNRSLDPSTKTRHLDIEYFKKYIRGDFQIKEV